MPSKTISLKLEAYRKLKGAKRYPGESFSQIIMRARWPEETVTAAELLIRCRELGPRFSLDELERIEEMKVSDSLPDDKWPPD